MRKPVITRRQALKSALVATGAAAFAGCRSLLRPALTVSTLASPATGPARVVLLRFGGGVRYEDVFGPEERCLAPSLRALAREGTLYWDLWNDHLTHHDCATLYMLTGRYGKKLDSNAKADENLAELAKAPLVHEVYRRAKSLPLYKALSVGMPNFSEHPLHGSAVRAASFARQVDPKKNVSLSGDPSLITPPELAYGNELLGKLALDLSGADAPIQSGARRVFLDAKIDEMFAKVMLPCTSLAPAWKQALGDRLMDGSPYLCNADTDAWLTDLTLGALSTVRPDLVTVGFVTPDLAHRGAWHEYAAAVRNVDLQVTRIVEFLTRDDYYKGRTLVLVAPDVGRGAVDFTEHDQPFTEPSHRRLFLVALGRGAKAGVVVTDRREQTTIAPTIAAALGFTLGQAEADALGELS